MLCREHWTSIRASVRASARGSVRASVRASVHVCTVVTELLRYITLPRLSDGNCCIRLWQNRIVELILL